MGLLYPFPVSPEETDFVRIETSPSGSIAKVELKTYGLPYLFWGYAAASLTVVFFLWLAVRAPLEKLKGLGGPDAMMAYGLEVFLVILVLSVFGFFFYEKRLVRTEKNLTIVHRIAGIPFSTIHHAISGKAFSLNHFIDSPNVARMQGGEEAQGFQNKGYFTLWVTTAEGKTLMVDRHSRKADLTALMALLNLPTKSE